MLERRLSRRDFLKVAAAAVGGLALNSCGRRTPSYLIPEGSPQDTPTNTAIPTLKSTVESTPTPENTATATEVSTETPTAAPKIIDRLHLDPAEQSFLVDHHINSVDASRNMFAITCDDFPNSPHQLESILDSLKGVGHATFFPIGKNLKLLADGDYAPYGWTVDHIKRIVEEGHEIGCHTYTHGLTPLTQLKDKDLDLEFSLWLDAMDEIIPGFQPVFFRAPGGTYDERVLRFGAKYGMQHAFWNLSSGGMDEATLDRVLTGAKPGGLLLTHMMRPYDIKYMGEIARDLSGRGYNLQTLSKAVSPSELLTF
ncbi:MAG: polysaccharide deacetylase family protein [Candidatus Gottesmanbacteria bacterium]|nr:polysaccharide deacetylase family protein [Candidatus Gottesmanbacteria bacterium]